MTRRFGAGPTVFLDLDGVMADFDGAFEPLFGFDHRKVDDEVMWKAINDHGSYFRDLPPCPDALAFYILLTDIDEVEPVILTACPVADFANVAEQKRGWVREHLGADVPIVFSPGGKTKPLYMHRPGDILIDDFEANIRRWRKAGGVGIHHTGDFVATARALSEAL